MTREQKRMHLIREDLKLVITIEKRQHGKASRPMATEERVLCFERKLLEELGVFQGLSLEIEKYLPVVTSASHLRYLNRSEAEHDKCYKQLIRLL